jgi:hypothetical protein
MKAALSLLLQNILGSNVQDVIGSGLAMSPRLHSSLTVPRVEMMNVMTTFTEEHKV